MEKYYRDHKIGITQPDMDGNSLIYVCNHDGIYLYIDKAFVKPDGIGNLIYDLKRYVDELYGNTREKSYEMNYDCLEDNN